MSAPTPQRQARRDSAPMPAHLPHNLEAEQSLLGAIMLSNGLAEFMPSLVATDFYDAIHGRIFHTIKQLLAQSRAADERTLAEFFTKDAGIRSIGGVEYILRLSSMAAPLKHQALSYAEMIRELAARRQLIKVGQGLMEAGTTLPDGETPMDVAIGAERALQAIGAGHGERDVSLREAGQRVVESLSRPYRGLSTGIGYLDNLIGGLMAPDLVILAGRPGMGKTSLAVNVAYNVAVNDIVDEDGQIIRPRIVAFFSMEMSAEQLAGRALARKSTTHGALAFGYSSLYLNDSRPSPADVAPLVPRLPSSLRIDDSSAQSVARIRAVCRDIRQRFGGLDLVVVDYLQLAVDPHARKDGRVQEVTAITAGLKGIAKDMQVPVLALSQLSRQVEGRIDKTPQNSDLRESGSIEQDADIIVFAYREHYYLSQNEPREREGESRDEFDARKAGWRKRKMETQNVFTAICGKRRSGPVGVAELECDLAHDIVSDPSQKNASTPRKNYWMDD